ncbi:alpha/beta hydrolase [uncultured Limosilactobacillus sp.]|uniref:alpha/beta hydrolase n=1 Tax=uncultured Limosilactobacillus sp. TaxID=2837629 RepID=UPI0025DA6340|nr:alpha/beta hydrolase [uncultured Limosilactobacillus sp.]
MKIIQLPLQNERHATHATLTAYLQTPTPHSPWQKFPPLIIVPGGSMTHIPKEETEKTAIAFAARGYQVFILRYTFLSEQTPLYPQPLIDLAQAVKTVKQKQAEWCLSDQLFILGFSAGGHVTALYNDYWSTKWFSQLCHCPNQILQPTKIVLGYPVIDLDAGFPADSHTISQWTADPQKYSASYHVNEANVPTFIWHTLDDPFVPVQNSFNYALALKKFNISQEIHLFTHGPHGMDIANQLVAHHRDGDQPHVAHWVALADEWLLNY